MKYLFLTLILTASVFGQPIKSPGVNGENIVNPAFRNAVLPSQSSHSGKFLTTDGAGAVTWATVTSNPTNGTNGQVLTSNGANGFGTPFTPGTAATAALLDSDTMTGATSSNVPSAESVVAYVAANAGGGSFSSLTGNATDNTSLASSLAGKAPVDALNSAKLQLPWTRKTLYDNRQGNFAPVLRTFTLGDSWFLPGNTGDVMNQMKSKIGDCGRFYGPANLGRLGGATATTGASSYALTPFGYLCNLTGSGQYLLGGAGSEGTIGTVRLPVARYISVAYEGLTGGSFQVQQETTTNDSWTTIATVATDSVASSGFRIWESSALTPISARVRINWVAGNLKIYGFGHNQLSMSENATGNRGGVVECNTAFGGSKISEWNLAPQQVWTALFAWLKPNIIFMREKADDGTSAWINEFSGTGNLLDKLRTARPECDIVWVGRHNTNDGDTKPAEVDAYMQNWCDTNEGMFVDIKSFMPDTYAKGVALGIDGGDNVHTTSRGGVMIQGIICDHIDAAIGHYFSNFDRSYSPNWGPRYARTGVQDLWEITFDGSLGGSGIFRFADMGTGTINSNAGWGFTNLGTVSGSSYHMTNGLEIGRASVGYTSVSNEGRWSFGMAGSNRTARAISARVEAVAGAVNGAATLPAVAAYGSPGQRVPILKVGREAASTGATTGTDLWGWNNDGSVAFEGHTGTGAQATASASAGLITSFTVTNGGSGYTVAPTVVLQNTSGGASGAGTAVLTDGVVTSITVTNAGTGYTNAPDVFLIPADGVDNAFETLFTYGNPTADTYIHTPAQSGTLAVIVTNTASLNYSSIAALGEETLTITVTGAVTTNTPSVELGWSAALETGIVVKQAWVSATNTVSVRVANITAGAIDPAAITCRATVDNF